MGEKEAGTQLAAHTHTPLLTHAHTRNVVKKKNKQHRVTSTGRCFPLAAHTSWIIILRSKEGSLSRQSPFSFTHTLTCSFSLSRAYAVFRCFGFHDGNFVSCFLPFPPLAPSFSLSPSFARQRLEKAPKRHNSPSIAHHHRLTRPNNTQQPDDASRIAPALPLPTPVSTFLCSFSLLH